MHGSTDADTAPELASAPRQGMFRASTATAPPPETPGMSLPPLPRLERHGTAARLLVDGQPFLMLAGELHNSSASSLAYLEPILDRLLTLHLNTVLVPLSWELVEPEEGCFDFALLDGIVDQARRRGLRLLFLWFGTLKNAISSYVPAWVKQDLARFPRAQAKPGENGWSLSVFHEATAAADARAFAAVMARLDAIDAAHRTVLMVQVENETGILGAARDHGPAAEAAFAAPVPAALGQSLQAHRAELMPELRTAWERAGARTTGTWTEVFGADADEIFMAWHTARFVDHVAAAGRAACNLPMFANAWLIAGPGYQPGQYPSGGPVSKLLDVWRAAAPHLDLLAPDIYLQDFRTECASYTRGGNPLLIPEAANGPVAAANALYAVGRHHALCFSPFAIDDLAPDHPLGESYRLLGNLWPLLAPACGSERLTGFLQQADEEAWTAEVGGYRFRARTRQPLAKLRVPGAALLLQTGADEFIAAGRSLIFTFEPLAPGLRVAELLWLDTGDVRHGTWVPGRRLNGDETFHGTGVSFGERLEVVRFRLHAYA